jgi:hypothetical protein
MTIATIGRPFLGADYMLRSGQAQFDNMFAGQIYFAGESGSDWVGIGFSHGESPSCESGILRWA